jgi:hypothetical protein
MIILQKFRIRSCRRAHASDTVDHALFFARIRTSVLNTSITAVAAINQRTRTMTTIVKLTASALILSAGLAAPAFADESNRLPFASEVNSCLAAVNANLDLESASRVRHLVKQQDRAGQSYAFAIETSVFSGDEEKRYAAYCVARGEGQPSKFRISEVTV